MTARATPSRRDTPPTVPFRASTVRQGVIQLGNTLVPLFAILTLMFVVRTYSYWIAIAIAPVAAGFFVRTFIIMHDCAHGSFMPSRRANEIIGFVTGVLTLTPFGQWRTDHALHHASSGDLDRRGFGDIDTLTVDEYLARNRWQRLKYRASRHPLVLFGLGPVYLLLIQRIQTPAARHGGKRAWSVHLTNLVIALLFLTLFALLGVGRVLSIYLPVYAIAVAAGIWLFYVQHQFDGAYWESHDTWDYADAALHGSSYYRLPRVLEWLTGSIGFHHVHHSDPRVPNYLLRRCHEACETFRAAPAITLRSSFHTLSLKLWDREQRRLVGFDAVRARLHGADQMTRAGTAQGGMGG
jgi:acyl-lipid omega-6 desaturase (Delta-12 desaturase)